MTTFEYYKHVENLKRARTPDTHETGSDDDDSNKPYSMRK